MTDDAKHLLELLASQPDKFIVQFNIPEADISEDIRHLILELQREYQRVSLAAAELYRDYHDLKARRRELAIRYQDAKSALFQLTDHIIAGRWNEADAMARRIQEKLNHD